MPTMPPTQTKPALPSPRPRSLAIRSWWLLIALSLGWGWHSFAQQPAPQIVWTSRPSQLQRGSSFVWKGHIDNASPKRMRAGLSVSLSITHNQKELSLGRAVVLADGTFVLRGQIPPHIAPRDHRIKASIWGRRIAVGQSPTSPSVAAPPARASSRSKPKPGRTKGTPGKSTPDKPTKDASRKPTTDSNKRKAPGKRKADRSGKANQPSDEPEGKDTSEDISKPSARPTAPGDRATAPRTKPTPEAQAPATRSPKKEGQSAPNKEGTSLPGEDDPALQAQKKAQAKRSTLWKQLREGWGPGTTSDAQRQRQQSERQRRKTQFLLPPGNEEPPLARSPLSPGTPPTPSQPTPGSPDPSNPHPSNPEQGSDTPGNSPQAQDDPINQANPRAQNGQGEQKEPDGQSGQGSPQDDSQGRDDAQRQGHSQGRQGRQRRGGRARRSGRQGRRPTQEPQYQPDLQTGVPGSQGQIPPPTGDQKGPPVMVPPSRRSATDRPSPPGGGGDNRLWSQARQSHLDMQTKGGHTYLRQVFEPYMPAHQRITAFDRVRLGYRLAMSSARKRRIRVGGQRSEARSYFVGRIHVVLYPGRWTPIPSVAPDARILWYQTTPEIPLEFGKDNGDIMFVRSSRQSTQRVFLTFGTDADRNYFGGIVPEGIRPARYARRNRPYVHPRIETTVKRHMHRLGLHRAMDLNQSLGKIIPFLRGFEAHSLQASELRGDAYVTLIRARKGVCRHRAMIFTVTMRALGYPARFVSNNAHAFAEIQYPDGRWRQIDLGGGDLPHYMGSWRGSSFKPPRDPFPRPPPTARTNHPDPSQRKHTQHPHPPDDAGSPSTKSTGQGHLTRHHKPPKRRKKRRDYISHSRLQ